MTQQRNWYAVITADVLYNENLNSTDKLLMAVAANMSNQRGYCFASNKALAAILQCSPSTVKRSIGKLEELHLIWREEVRDENNEVIERRIHLTSAPLGAKPTPLGANLHPPRGKNAPHNNKENNTPIKQESETQLSRQDIELVCMQTGVDPNEAQKAAIQCLNHYEGIGKPVHNKVAMVVSWIAGDLRRTQQRVTNEQQPTVHRKTGRRL